MVRHGNMRHLHDGPVPAPYDAMVVAWTQLQCRLSQARLPLLSSDCNAWMTIVPPAVLAWWCSKVDVCEDTQLVLERLVSETRLHAIYGASDSETAVEFCVICGGRLRFLGREVVVDDDCEPGHIGLACPCGAWQETFHGAEPNDTALIIRTRGCPDVCVLPGNVEDLAPALTWSTTSHLFIRLSDLVVAGGGRPIYPWVHARLRRLPLVKAAGFLREALNRGAQADIIGEWLTKKVAAEILKYAPLRTLYCRCCGTAIATGATANTAGAWCFSTWHICRMGRIDFVVHMELQEGGVVVDCVARGRDV
jgi:hypothetical protein